MLFKITWKKSLFIVLLSVLIFTTVLIGFIISNKSIANAQDSCKNNETNSSLLYEKLSKLDGVHDITAMSTEKYKEKYIFKITQPLDWNNPAAGIFDQRVVISFNGFDKYNALETEGYFLRQDRVMGGDYQDDFVKHYSCNQINVEHRYFEESIPAGLSTKDVKNWEYLTTENAANDHHKVYTELSKILTGKWIATGASKGGETTMLYGYYFPNDMDVYVPYVAPWCVFDDTRAYDFIWNRVGDERYGKEQAKKYRDLMFNFTLDYYSHRDEIRPIFCEKASQTIFFVKDHFGEERSPLIFYDMNVLDMIFGTWQYDQEFDKIQNIYNMSWKTQHDEKIAAMVGELTDFANNLSPYKHLKNTNNSDIEDKLYAYEVQALREQGNYLFDFDTFRKILEQKGITTGLEIKPGEEVNLHSKLFVHKNFIDTFSYDPTTHNNLVNWINNTKQKIMFIHGSSDPWYAMRINDVLNKDNIKMYVSNKASHRTKIEHLTNSEINEVWTTLDKWLTDAPYDPPVNPDDSTVNPSQLAATSDNTINYVVCAASLALACGIYCCYKLRKANKLERHNNNVLK